VTVAPAVKAHLEMSPSSEIAAREKQVVAGSGRATSFSHSALARSRPSPLIATDFDAPIWPRSREHASGPSRDSDPAHS
ncbi:hypothetical protein, partial [Acinetobacter pittii]|uniref:hypothetical protein n=1 Tax=Acinetobacter pittii TaxID=48296 RepID=UPI001BDBA739